MFWRALLAFLILPGTVAFLVPVLVIGPGVNGESVRAIGFVPVIVGSVLLLWCVRDFYVAGKGTLAPWAPPRNLVAIGLYRFSRNPMYVAVMLILSGWALGFRSGALWIYAPTVPASVTGPSVFLSYVPLGGDSGRQEEVDHEGRFIGWTEVGVRRVAAFEEARAGSDA